MVSSYIQTGANNSTLDQPGKFKLSFPIDPRPVILNLSKYLLEYEKTEILDYDLIYFLNINERKNSRLKTPEGVENCGFDNDENE